MVSKKVLFEQLRNKLIYDFDQNVQAEALKVLWKEGEPEPEALPIMIDALKATQVSIKDEILHHLCFLDDAEVYGLINGVFLEGSSSVRWNLLEAVEKLKLNSLFMEKLEELKSQHDRYPLLAAMIKLTGWFQDPELMEFVLSRYTRLDDDDVRLAVIDAVEYHDPAQCPNQLLTAMKFFSPEVASRALDLIGKLKDKNTVMPMMYVLGEVGGLMAEKIVTVLKEFDQQELEETVLNNVTLNKEKKDYDLIHAWIQYLERSGDNSQAFDVRRNFNIDTDLKAKAIIEASAKHLKIEFKEHQGIAMVSLSGVLDMYTLSRFEQAVKKMITNGFAKLLMVCKRLTVLDRHAIAYLDRTDANLRKIMGGIKYVDLTCLPEAQKTVMMPEAEFYDDLQAAVKSCTEIQSDRVVKIAPELFEKDFLVEITFSFGRQEKHRAAKVISTDENWMLLVWETFDETDMFQEFESDDVIISFVVKDEIFAAETKVCEQGDLPRPYIKIRFPRTGRPMKRILHPQVPCRIPVTFRKMTGAQEISKNAFPGICLKISEGDIQFMTPLPLAKNSHLVLTFDPSELTIKHIIGQVVRRVEHVENKRKLYDYQIRFATVRNDCRATIKKYVFQKISDKDSGKALLAGL